MAAHRESKVPILKDPVRVEVYGVSIVLVVLPDVGQCQVQAAAPVASKQVLPHDPVVQVVRVPQVFRVLDDAAAVVQEPGPIDHVSNLGHVELVQLAERREHVDRLVSVKRTQIT